MANKLEEVTWLGEVPTKCEFCETPIVRKFYDARIRTSGGIIAGCACSSCHTFEGIGLGSGKGQEYTLKADGKWHKTGG
jgi:hypothetical protein